MRERFRILQDTIKKTCGRDPVYYFPNRGNWGDGLIRHGTLKFFNDININFKELTVNDYKEIAKKKKSWHSLFKKKSTFIYGGGGAWCKLWNHSIDYVSEIKRQFKIIVLPSTYETSYSNPNTIFFCRDTNESQQNMPGAIFCHDMAFYIGKSIRAKKGSGSGYFYRGDKESSTKIHIPSSNNDISLKGNHLSDPAGFFEEINKFSVIYTDRLHVAIAACLLEKETHLNIGSYFKSRAVYMSSMKNYFDNIYFHEGPE